MIAEASDNEPIEGSQFSGQLPDEEVYIFERRYWFVLLQWTGGPVALTMGLMLVTRLVIALAESAGTSLPLLLRILLWAFIPLVGYLWTLWRFLNWSNDRFIVTDRRVIHIDEIPFIRLRRDEAPLDMIQDVTVHMRGLWQNLLYFGNVINQTAGTLGTVRFTGIRKPRKVQAIILDLMRGADREGTSTSSEGEGLRWESERLRREQMGLVLRRLFWAEPQFEEHQVIWRKHWLMLVRALGRPVFALVVIALLWLTTCTLLRYSPWIDVLLGLALVGILTWAIWRTLNWWNDLYVLTDERVVDVEKVPIIREERREARLDRIQDVRYDQPTIIYRIFDFGHVWLETAGGIGRFTFDYIPQPRMVQAEIFRRLEAFRQRAEQRQREALLELLERYHQSIRG